MFNIFKRGNSQPKQQLPVQSPRTQIPVQINQPPQSPKAQFIYSNEVKLRENFADQLLELELEAEAPNVSIETITSLLSLYREGVEYFEAIQSNKYLVFKNKIQNLMMKKNVQAAMNYKAPEQKKNLLVSQEQSKQNEQLQDEQKQKELKIRLDYIRQQDQQKSVDNLMNEHTEKQEKIHQIISEDLKEQNDTIQKRIQQRRNSSIKKDGQTFVIQESPKKPAQNQQQLEPSFTSSHAPVIKSANKSYQPYQPRGRLQQEDQQL